MDYAFIQMEHIWQVGYGPYYRERGIYINPKILPNGVVSNDSYQKAFLGDKDYNE